MTILSLIHEEVETFRLATADLEVESCAVGFVSAGSGSRYVVRGFAAVPENAYLERNAVCATLSPEFCLHVANRARVEGTGVVFAHTHVGDVPLERFSSIDDAGESTLLTYFSRRVPAQQHFSCLVTRSALQCRMLGGRVRASVRLVGKSIKQDLGRDHIASLEHHDRQIRAFGRDGQRILEHTRVAVVGLGGTGSVVVQQLAHLGVRDFVFIDPDVVEVSNLNRLVGATTRDIGTSKTAVAKSHVLSINASADIVEVVGNVVDHSIASRLLDCDFVFLCTDSHASRAVVNQVAYQYLIPCIDMGVAIHAADGVVSHVVGRVQMLAPGLPCLTCGTWIDSNQVRLEMMTDEQRARDPYFVGPGVEQPAVITLNSTVASLSVTMCLSALTDLPADARLLLYDAIKGTVRSVTARRDPGCIVCSSSGALAKGQTWPLPTRHDSK